jgi:hypothetical protein
MDPQNPDNSPDNGTRKVRDRSRIVWWAKGEGAAVAIYIGVRVQGFLVA